MSFAKKLHKRIEEGNAEEKRRAIMRLSADPEFSKVGDGVRIFDRRKKILLISSLFLALLLFLSVFLLVFFGRGRKEKVRYCASDDCQFKQTEQTLKDYSAAHGGDVLYFDWYEKTSFHSSSVALLKDTSDIICFNESIYDEDSGYEVQIYVTDDHTQIEFLESYDILCINTEEGGVTVKWGGNFESYAMFEYRGFKYYLKIRDANEPSLARDYANLLLGQAES